MADTIKYANLTGYPVILPNQRGGRTVLNPNECRSEHWFSRFVGKRQLTAVPADWKPGRPPRPVRVPSGRKAPPSPKSPRPTVPMPACNKGCETTCETVCESNRQATMKMDHGVQVGFHLWYCAYCAYQTDTSYTDLMKHVKAYHPEKLSFSTQSAKVTSIETDAKQDSEEKDPVEQSPPEESEPETPVVQADVTPETVEEAEPVEETEEETSGFPCPHCVWVGRSKGALTRHINKYHRQKDESE